MSFIKQQWHDFITLLEPLRTAQLAYWSIGVGGLFYRFAQHGLPRVVHIVVALAFVGAFVAYFAIVFKCYPNLTLRQELVSVVASVPVASGEEVLHAARAIAMSAARKAVTTSAPAPR